jgi:hypothetical protein
MLLQHITTLLRHITALLRKSTVLIHYITVFHHHTTPLLRHMTALHIVTYFLHIMGSEILHVTKILRLHLPKIGHPHFIPQYDMFVVSLTYSRE